MQILVIGLRNRGDTSERVTIAERGTLPNKSQFEKVINVKCPYCNKEMEKGLIQSPQELAWIKGTKRKLFGRAMFHEDSIVLSKLSFTKGSAVVANLCRSCQKVVIDCSDRDSDLND